MNNSKILNIILALNDAQNKGVILEALDHFPTCYLIDILNIVEKLLLQRIKKHGTQKTYYP